MNRMRRAAVAAAALIALGTLSGCSADWSGATRLSSPECQVAAQLFPQADAAASPLSATELAEDLRPHVPIELDGILDAFAQSTSMAETASAAEVATGSQQRDRQQRARAVLEEWAVLACGSAITGDAVTTGDASESLPPLAEMPVLRSEIDGTAQIAITGALDPLHAVVLCEAARTQEGLEARVSVADADGFPLALAEPAAACDYDPALLTAISDADPASGD